MANCGTGAAFGGFERHRAAHRLSATVLAASRAVARGPGEHQSMKKSTQPTSTGEPMGIVITTGVRTPIEPVVRAYMWGPAPDEPVVTGGTPAA